MLANVDVRGVPVPTARFMGGRSLRSLPAKRRPTRTKPTSPAMIASGVMALPAFTDQGGPFGARKGRIEGEAPATPKRGQPSPRSTPLW